MAVKLVGNSCRSGSMLPGPGMDLDYSVHIIDIKWIAVNIEGYAVAPPIMGGIRH